MSRKRRRSIFDLMREYMEDLEAAAEEMAELAIAERPSWDVRSSCLEPLCNIFVTTDEVVVTADLPYTEPETVKVEAIGEDRLEIGAKMRQKLRFDDFGITHREGEFSSFRCQVRVPVPVNMKRMKVYFKRGILEIHLPRRRGYEIKVE